MNVRAIVAALPVPVLLAAAGAIASPVTLSPLGTAPRTQVATVGSDSCAGVATPARLAQAFFEYPAVAEMDDIEGVAAVGVSLSASGRPTRAWLIKSTGTPLLDSAALKTALASSYVAEEVQGSPVGGDYQIVVHFSLDQK